MAGNSAAASQASLQQRNMTARQMLLGSAPAFQKNLGTFQGTNGQTTRVKLFNVGITTKLRLFVQATITIGTAAAVASTKAPWNLISRVRLSDYDGTDRVNLSGFQLFILQCVRNRALFGYQTTPQAAVFTNPIVPTAVGNQTVQFFIDVPVAFDIDNPVVQLRDLRGAILSQTAVGDMYLNVDWVNSLLSTTGDVDSLYSGSGTTTVVGNPVSNFINMTVFQQFLMPQAVDFQGGVPIPQIDLMTVYELAGNVKSTDNIAVNTEKLMNYPNVRSVIGAYFNYVTGGAMAQGNISKLRTLANGNNTMVEATELAWLFEQRTWMWSDGDTVPGVYWKTHREKPIETALYGNVQMGLTVNTASGGNQYVEQAFESFYTKGIALPGLIQASA
jgi:hypothetical protein